MVFLGGCQESQCFCYSSQYIQSFFLQQNENSLSSNCFIEINKVNTLYIHTCYKYVYVFNIENTIHRNCMRPQMFYSSHRISDRQVENPLIDLKLCKMFIRE